MRALMWFRSDLRISDKAALWNACRSASEGVIAVLGKLFGGATAYPKGKGVWRDDDQGGKLLFDEPVVIQCYTSEAAIRRQAGALREFLVRMGTECRQGAVGFVIDRDYLEIRFPLVGKGG